MSAHADCDEIRRELERLAGPDGVDTVAKIWPTVEQLLDGRIPLSITERAQALADARGTFALHFDAGQNPASPDYRPWTVKVGSDYHGGYEVGEVIDTALSEYDARFPR